MDPDAGIRFSVESLSSEFSVFSHQAQTPYGTVAHMESLQSMKADATPLGMHAIK